ncbi:hypothetical protein D918_06901 [Trichuris suis]|nr:hypothetical protein D918_06901 [Trichuris suis]
MYYCRLCSYKSEIKRCVTLHVQAVHHFGTKKSLQFVSDLNPTVVQPKEKSTHPFGEYSNAISAEIEALQRILKEAEDVMAARRNPTHCANRYAFPKCIGCLAYRCEMDSMEKIVKEMELIEKLKTIDKDGSTPLPCVIATPEQLTALENLRYSCLQLLVTLGFVSLHDEV